MVLDFHSGQSLVISSSGPAARVVADAMGVFDYNPEVRVYQQRHNQSIVDDYRYLSQSNKSSRWLVANVPGIGSGWLGNRNTSSSVPASGWQYWDNGIWAEDSSITIRAGDIDPCPSVTIKVTGAAHDKWPTCCEGTFVFNNTWVWGRPVYYRKDGHMLYMNGSDDNNSGFWNIGPKYGEYWMYSTNGPLHPTDAIFWKYWDGETDRAAQVEIVPATNEGETDTNDDQDQIDPVTNETPVSDLSPGMFYTFHATCLNVTC